MKVLVVGATGALGQPTARALLEAGHEVVGTSRARLAEIEQVGARAVTLDILDPTATERVVAEVAPDAIVQLATALPEAGPAKKKDLEATNRLRTEGTANLLAAARTAGVLRYVSESIALGYGDHGDEVVTEVTPFATEPTNDVLAPMLAALRAQDEGVRSFGGTVLRFGLLYGPTCGSTRFTEKMAKRRLLASPVADGLLPWIHVDDGAASVVSAVGSTQRGQAYNVVDDEPMGLRDHMALIAESVGAPGPKVLPARVVKATMPFAHAILSARIRASNERAKAELGWIPRYPSARDGLLPPRG